MTFNEKQKFIAEIVSLLQVKLTIDTAAENVKQPKPESVPQKVEMLTIKESVTEVKGLSEHTLRQLIAQGKIPFIRTGQGKHGKILISKKALLEYFN